MASSYSKNEVCRNSRPRLSTEFSSEIDLAKLAVILENVGILHLNINWHYFYSNRIDVSVNIRKRVKTAALTRVLVDVLYQQWHISKLGLSVCNIQYAIQYKSMFIVCSSFEISTCESEVSSPGNHHNRASVHIYIISDGGCKNLCPGCNRSRINDRRSAFPIKTVTHQTAIIFLDCMSENFRFFGIQIPEKCQCKTGIWI